MGVPCLQCVKAGPEATGQIQASQSAKNASRLRIRASRRVNARDGLILSGQLAICSFSFGGSCVFLLFQYLQLKCCPPSTFIDWPVMFLEASVTKKTTIFPMSSGVWGLPKGIRCSTFLLNASFFVVPQRWAKAGATNLVHIGVSTMPGQTAFTLILYGANSSARHWVKPMTANFEAE